MIWVVIIVTAVLIVIGLIAIASDPGGWDW